MTQFIEYQNHRYPIILVGKQEWMLENLQAEFYNDGTPIPELTDAIKWKEDTQGAMCYYNNDKKNRKKYGALYNWYAINTGKLAPKGWRIASDEDFKKLEAYFGLGKEELDQIDWRGESGKIGEKVKNVLKVEMGGIRASSGGSFSGWGSGTYWWSSTAYDATYSWDRALDSSRVDVHRANYMKSCGFSVRCVRDLEAQECVEVTYFSIRQFKTNALLQELKRRGYKGELKSLKKIRF